MVNAEIIDKARQGDLDAFNQLVLQYQDPVYRQGCWILGDEQAAADATQETFLRAYRSLRNYRGGSFRGWLLRIITNLCLDQVRSAKRHCMVPLEAEDPDGQAFETTRWLTSPDPSPEELAENQEVAEVLRRGLARLTREYRMAMVMVDVEGLPYDEAASALHIRVGTLKSRLSRARMKMRAYLAGESKHSEKPGVSSQSVYSEERHKVSSPVYGYREEPSRWPTQPLRIVPVGSMD